MMLLVVNRTYLAIYLPPLKPGQRRTRGQDVSVKLVAEAVARRLARGPARRLARGPARRLARGSARRLARGPARRQGLKDKMFWVEENIPGVIFIRLLMVTVVI